MIQIRNKNTVFSSIPNFEGSAVYAITDNDGKSYIGSTSDLQSRIRTWNACFREVKKGGQRTRSCTQALADAILAGNTFSISVVTQIPEGANHTERVKLEQKAIESFGGIDNTYNSNNAFTNGIRQYSQSQNKATQKYIANNLEQVRFRVKKGELQKLKDCATSHGLSLAQYLIYVVNKHEGRQVLTPSDRQDE